MASLAVEMCRSVSIAAGALALASTCGLCVAHASACRFGIAGLCVVCSVVWVPALLGETKDLRVDGVAVACTVGVACLSLVESDSFALATDDETELAWLARHGLAVFGARFGAIRCASAAAGRCASAALAWAPGATSRRSDALASICFSAVASRAYCAATRARTMSAVFDGACLAAVAGGSAAAALLGRRPEAVRRAGAPATSVRRRSVAAAVAAVAAVAAAPRECAWCVQGDVGADPGDVGAVIELEVRAHADLAALWDAAYALVGDADDGGVDAYARLAVHPWRGGGGASSEHAYHRRRTVAEWAGETLPLQQDVVVELRHRKRELRAYVLRLLRSVFGDAAAPPSDPDDACVVLDAPSGPRRGFDRACSTGIGTAWKLRGDVFALNRVKRVAKNALNVTDGAMQARVLQVYFNSRVFERSRMCQENASTFRDLEKR